MENKYFLLMLLLPLLMAGCVDNQGENQLKELNDTCLDSCGDGICNLNGCAAADCICAETKDSCPADCVEECYQKDSLFNAPTSVLEKCCEGLKIIPAPEEVNLRPDGKCPDIKGQAIKYTCAECGNGVCNDDENKCNCPEDCNGINPYETECFEDNTFVCMRGAFQDASMPDCAMMDSTVEFKGCDADCHPVWDC